MYYFNVTDAMRSWGVEMSEVRMDTSFRACRWVEFEVGTFSGRDVSLLLDDVIYLAYNITEWHNKQPGIKGMLHKQGW